MRVPVMEGLIRRRILVNFRVDPALMQAQLPSPFRPKLQDGHAIAGICLIRLEELRPRGLPRLVGLTSENAAHRVAVVWRSETGEAREGVFISRRDSGSLLAHLAGGRLFPGEHNRARFRHWEEDDRVEIAMTSKDAQVAVRLRGSFGGQLPSTSCFASLSDASRFFEAGSLGYSVTREPGRLDGLRLETHGWRMEPLNVDDVYASYFGDEARFPRGTAVFDCALGMRNLRHEWHSVDELLVQTLGSHPRHRCQLSSSS